MWGIFLSFSYFLSKIVPSSSQLIFCSLTEATQLSNWLTDFSVWEIRSISKKLINSPPVLIFSIYLTYLFFLMHSILMSSCGHMKECKQIQKQLGNKLGFFYCTSHKFQGARGGANGVYPTRSKKQASCIDIIVYRKIWKNKWNIKL